MVTIPPALKEKVMASPLWDMPRDKLLARFKGENFLGLSHRYFWLVVDLLQRALAASAHLNHVREHPYECLVFSQTLRVRRYCLALANLIVQNGPGFLVCNDGSFPILKSLFELVIEARMVPAYLNTFGDTPERRRELTQRVLDFADLNKKWDNFKFKFMPALLPDEIKSDMMKQEEARPKAESEERMNALARKLGADSYKECRHWFPTKGPNGTPIIKENRRDFGSVRWRCEDVLGGLSSAAVEREFWADAYVSLYEVLNTYSHPVLGYDDCFRDENERLFDYFSLSVGIITPMHKWFLPNMLLELQADDGILEAKKAIDQVFGDMVMLCLIYKICIDRKDRAGFQA